MDSVRSGCDEPEKIFTCRMAGRDGRLGYDGVGGEELFRCSTFTKQFAVPRTTMDVDSAE